MASNFRATIALAAMLCAGAATVLGADAAAAREPKIGEPAPDFHLTTFDGRKIALADLKGQVVVLNFWATWCVPCKAEMPLLDAYVRHAGPRGLQVLAVATEDSVPLFRLKPLASALSLPLVRGFHGNYAPIDGAVPTNYIIDRSGIVRYAKAGALTLDALNALLPPLLNTPAAASIAQTGG